MGGASGRRRLFSPSALIKSTWLQPHDIHTRIYLLVLWVIFASPGWEPDLFCCSFYADECHLWAAVLLWPPAGSCHGWSWPGHWGELVTGSGAGSIKVICCKTHLQQIYNMHTTVKSQVTFVSKASEKQDPSVYPPVCLHELCVCACLFILFHWHSLYAEC